jgi:hypothetical protein
MASPGAGGCIAFAGDVVFVDLAFDQVVAGDQLTVTPLNKRGQMIAAYGQFQ